ncbi:MAG: hypothetical protein RLZZ600_1057 [Actinomycetota bacterium]
MAMGAGELELLIEVVPLAIGAAFTPSLFALQILTTSSPRWRSRSLAFALGSASAFLLACALLYVGFSQLPHKREGEPSVISGVIALTAAVVLAGVAIWLFLPHRELADKVEKGLVARIDRAHLVTFFGVAFLLSIKDVTSFALIVPALHETAAAQVGTLFKLATVLLVFALALFPVILPPLWRTLRGASATKDLSFII